MNVWMCAEFLCALAGARDALSMRCVRVAPNTCGWVAAFSFVELGSGPVCGEVCVCVAVCVGRPWWWPTITNHDEGEANAMMTMMMMMMMMMMKPKNQKRNRGQ